MPLNKIRTKIKNLWCYFWLNMFVCVCLVMPNSLWFHGLWNTRVICPWNFSEKNTRVSCHWEYPKGKTQEESCMGEYLILEQEDCSSGKKYSGDAREKKNGVHMVCILGEEKVKINTLLTREFFAETNTSNINMSLKSSVLIDLLIWWIIWKPNLV